MERRRYFDDTDWYLERQTYNLNYEFWERVYKPDSDEFTGQKITFGGTPVEQVVTGVSDIDEYWKTIGQKRSINGSEAIQYRPTDWT
jgi:hypothetical protein